MYNLLFFSPDPASLTIWRNIKKVEPNGQRTLPLGAYPVVSQFDRKAADRPPSGPW
jgi:hypothetical protein